MRDCVMLDVDGVLVNGRPGDGLSWARDIEEDLGIAPEALQEEFFARFWPGVIVGRTGLLEALEACMPLLSRSVTPAAFVDYWFERDSRVDGSILADCSTLREAGTRVFLATNQEHLRAAYPMDRLGLGRHVDGIFYSADLAVRKPDRAFFEAAGNRAGYAPEQIVLVDDTKANADGAIAAGWAGLHWTGEAGLIELLERPMAR